MYCPLFRFCFFMPVNTHKQTQKGSNQESMQSGNSNDQTWKCWAPGSAQNVFGLLAPRPKKDQGSRAPGTPTLGPWEQSCLARKPFEPALARMRLPLRKSEDIPLYTLSSVGRNLCERALARIRLRTWYLPISRFTIRNVWTKVAQSTLYALTINPLNPKIQIWILICCPYSFPTEVMGRSW